jgi:hypothetical protein
MNKKVRLNRLANLETAAAAIDHAPVIFLCFSKSKTTPNPARARSMEHTWDRMPEEGVEEFASRIVADERARGNRRTSLFCMFDGKDDGLVREEPDASSNSQEPA